MSTTSVGRPAGCLVRTVALVIDVALLSVLLVIVKLILGLVFELELQGMVLDPAGQAFDRLTNRYDLIWFLLVLLLPLAYAVLTEMSGRAATLGKRLVGIAVSSARGTRAGPLRVLARNLIKPISAAPCWIGFAMAILPGKRALHDLLTGSRVIHSRRDH